MTYYFDGWLLLEYVCICECMSKRLKELSSCPVMLLVTEIVQMHKYAHRVVTSFCSYACFLTAML